MSVDTYLKGKSLAVYRRIPKDDVEILISPSLDRWARHASMRVRNLIVRKQLKVDVEHGHTVTCGHARG